MKLNGWRFFVVVLQNLIILRSKADRASSCTTSSFTRTVGYVLHGFVLGEMKVPSLLECTMRCAVGVNCLSLNILTNADGSFACQLNSGLKENAAREQFVQHAAGEYIAFTVMFQKHLSRLSHGRTGVGTSLHEVNSLQNPINVSKFEEKIEGGLWNAPVHLADINLSTFLEGSVLEEKPCINNGASCDIGTPWHAFNQSYFTFVAPVLNFDEAMKFCRAEKGDLASTASEEEQTFLYNTFLKNNSDVEKKTWVGLNEKADEGVRVWTDGSPVSYTRFADGQPDNTKTKDICFVMDNANGYLHDLSCSFKRHFICETTYSSLYP